MTGPFTGIGRYGTELVPRLVGSSPGMRFWLMGTPTSASRFAPLASERVRVDGRCVPIPDHPRSDLWLQLELPRLLRRARVRVHLSLANYLPLLGGGARHVVTIHDMVPFRHPEADPLRFTLFLKTMLRLAARRADRILAVSRFTASEIVEILGVPEDRVRVVPNGPTATLGPLEPGERARRLERIPHLATAPERPFILSVGARVGRKNLPMLVKAFGLLDPDLPQDLVLVGPEGPDSAALRSAIAGSGRAGRIHLVDYADDDTLRALYAGASLMVYPSLYEGFGIPLLEAFGAGAPVVCSRTGALPEVAGEAAVLADPRSPDDLAGAMGRVLADPALAARLVASGRERLAQFSWERAADQTRMVLEELLGGDAPSSRVATSRERHEDRAAGAPPGGTAVQPPLVTAVKADDDPAASAPDTEATRRRPGPGARFVIFASAYHDEPLWTNKQHVARVLSGTHPVLYVEPGLAVGRVGDRLLHHPSRLLPVRALAAGFTLLSPWFLLLRRGPAAIRDLSFDLLARMIRSHLAPDRPTVLLVYHPAGIELADRLPVDHVVYDCVDHLVSQPHLARRPDLAARLDAWESRLLERADLVLCTSRPLLERCAPRTRNAHLLENVADFDHFHRAADPALEVPSRLAAIPGPRIGFAGALDPYKVDYDLLDRLVAALPAAHWVLIGPRSTVEPHRRLERLAATGRVHPVGAVSYADLPAWLKGLDVILLPYPLTEHTRHVFPLKFFESLATGRPVLSTPLPSLEAHRDVCPMPDTLEGWTGALRMALEHPGRDREARLARARSHTWHHRVARILELVEALPRSENHDRTSSSAPTNGRPRARVRRE